LDWLLFVEKAVKATSCYSGEQYDT
jgi:hypothetical protein